MAYTVDSTLTTPENADTALKTLLDDSGATTIHGIGITSMGNNRVLCWVAYE